CVAARKPVRDDRGGDPDPGRRKAAGAAARAGEGARGGGARRPGAAGAEVGLRAVQGRLQVTLPTFVHDDTGSLSAGATVELAGDEGRHAVAARRLRAGERIVLTDGLGAPAPCTVREVGKASLTADVDEITHQPAEEPLVTVVQAIPKGDRGELAVEVLTEVGADVIVPWSAERCVSVWRGDRAAKSLHQSPGATGPGAPR